MTRPLRSDPPLSAPTVQPHGEAMSRTLLRLPGDGPPRLTLTAADRLVVSSTITGGRMVARRRGMLSSMGLALLLLLAMIGAVTLYHTVASVFIS